MTPTIVKVVLLSVMWRPSTAGSEPKNRCHAAALMTAASASGRSSSAISVRPSCAGTPSISKSAGDTIARGAAIGPSAVCSCPLIRLMTPAICENDVVRARQSRNSSCVSPKRRLYCGPSARLADDVLGDLHQPIGIAVRQRPQHGSVLMTLKIAVLTPTPSATVTMAASVKPG